MTERPFPILRYETLDSTNEEAKRLLNSGKIQGICLLLANSQSAGKGTQGRTWASPAGAGLYCSIVHPASALWASTLPAEPTTRLAQLPFWTLAAGVACAHTIQELTGLAIQLKPINDLYLHRQKLGGILTESLIRQGQLQALITGIGVNIREHTAVQAACDQDQRSNQPTSLQANLPVDWFNQWHPDALKQELCLAMASHLTHAYQQLAQHGERDILRQYIALKLAEYPMPAALQTWLP